MRDPYEVLGISRNISEEAMKKAYRKLAKQYHPDLHPGDKAMETRFKEITAAYDMLSDPEKRRRFDRGEIDASGAERNPFRGQQQQGNWQRGGASHGGFRGGGGFNPEDIFGMFSQGRGGGNNIRQRGSDVKYAVNVSFLEAVNGSKKRLTLPDGKVIDIAIPEGTEDGALLRLREQGNIGINGGANGDALLEIHYDPHPFFERKGLDIHLEVAITLYEAILGANITVPTVAGNVVVKVPNGANSGTILRLRDRGVPAAGGKRGNQFIKLMIQLPDQIDSELSDFINDWSRKYKYRVRHKLGIDE